MATGRSAPEVVRSLYLLWGHHPEQGRSGLSVGRIVRAGVQLADAQGLAATSMRKVAEELGVSTMALYHHVPGKEDLTALMTDDVYGELYGDVDHARPADDWRTGLREVAERNWQLLERHPWLLDVHEARSLLGPNASRKYEAELGVLDGIGLSDLDMESSLTALLNIVEGAARHLRADHAARSSSGLTDAEWWAVVAPALDHLMADEDYPVSGRVGTSVGTAADAARDPRRTFRLGVSLVVDGVAELIRASGSDPDAPG
ncbi:TetR/AcrR family transcriptional regulator [Georgenia sp. Z1491]|uniref:TetR/AcrR family transcriptional regulator n=1 Tax=Georgenia sp. Z1491 TaxID=3416707 RepID=UPI003CF6AC4D